MYSVFRILPASDSWAWINHQEDFENAHKSALHALRRAACIVLTIMNEIVSKSAGQYSDHIAVRKKDLFAETVGKIVFYV